MLTASLAVIYFFLYSLLGWVAEFIYMLIKDRRLKRPDFLWMPLSPPYGLGSLGIILLIYPYVTNPFLVFISSIVLTTIIEYISHVVIEKLFHVELWNYKKKRFNFQGRVALLNSLLFGVLGLFLVYVAHPFFAEIIQRLPTMVLVVAASVIALALVIDLASATGTLARLRTTNIKNTLDDIVDYIQEQMDELMALDKSPVLRRTRSFLLKLQRTNVRRLLKAYPNARLKTRKKRR